MNQKTPGIRHPRLGCHGTGWRQGRASLQESKSATPRARLSSVVNLIAFRLRNQIESTTWALARIRQSAALGLGDLPLPKQIMAIEVYARAATVPVLCSRVQRSSERCAECGDDDK